MADLDAWIKAQLKRGYSRQQINAYLARNGYGSAAVAEVDKMLSAQFSQSSPPRRPDANAPAKASLKHIPKAYILLAVAAVAGLLLLVVADRIGPQGGATAQSQTEKVCKSFKTATYAVPCTEAVALAVADSPGTVEKVSVGMMKVPDPSITPPGVVDKQMWLVDINLEKPQFDTSGKEIKSLRIGIGLNEAVGIHRRPLE